MSALLSCWLHPQNPHYFQYQNKPVLVVGSGEHYGAVVNLDFDYTRYLQAWPKPEFEKRYVSGRVDRCGTGEKLKTETITNGRLVALDGQMTRLPE